MPGDYSLSDHDNIAQAKNDSTRTRSSSTSTTRISNKKKNSDSSSHYYYGSLGENDNNSKERHDNEHYHSIIEDSELRSDEYLIPIVIPDDSDCCCSTGGGEKLKEREEQEQAYLLKDYQNDETTILYVSTSDEESQSFSKAHNRSLVVIPKPGFFFSKILGFQSNPFVKSDSNLSGGTPLGSSDTNNSRNSPMADLRLSMLSTLSTSYNTLSISWAIQIMSKIYPINEGEHSICSTALLAGMIFGQLFGGALGDYIGRHQAMTFVMFTQILAALASAFSFDRGGAGIGGGLYNDFDYWNCFGYHFNYPKNLTIYKLLAGE